MILSRIRRTADPLVLLMEALAMYASFLVAARYVDPKFLAGSLGPLRLAIPAAVTLLVLILADAYADPRKRWPLKPALGAVLALGIACLSQAVLWARASDPALPRAILLLGAGLSLLLVGTIRWMFPPIGDLPRGAGGPALWLKQEMAPWNIPPWVRRSGEAVAALALAAGITALVVQLPKLLPPLLIVVAGAVAYHQLNNRR